MKTASRHWKAIVIFATVIAASVVTSGTLPNGSDANKTRTIIVTAADMMFNASNPTIELRAGEMVRLVLRNEDPGMKHDLAIPSLGLRTEVIRAGQSAVLKFRVPKQGRFEYFCSFHPVSMRGYIEVVGTPRDDRAGSAEAF